MPARPLLPRPSRRTLAAGLTLALLLPVAACGDDDEGATTSATTEADTTTASTEADTTEADTTETAAADEPDEPADDVAITGVDYAFEGVPETIAAGTRLAFTNDSTAEVHEIVAVRIDDAETRPVTDIVADPAGVGALLGGGAPATVIVASPGGSDPGAVLGDGTLTEPGRYALICTIPTGVDPQEYLDAAAAAQGGPPDVEGGPPHFVQGMVAELTVEG